MWYQSVENMASKNSTNYTLAIEVYTLSIDEATSHSVQLCPVPMGWGWCTTPPTRTPTLGSPPTPPYHPHTSCNVWIVHHLRAFIIPYHAIVWIVIMMRMVRQGCLECNIEALMEPEKSTFMKADQKYEYLGQNPAFLPLWNIYTRSLTVLGKLGNLTQPKIKRSLNFCLLL